MAKKKAEVKVKEVEDNDGRGHAVNYEVELWRFTNSLRIATQIFYKQFKTKAKAQSYAAAQIKSGLVDRIRVTRLTFDRPVENGVLASSRYPYSIVPTRKLIYSDNSLKENTNEK